MNTLLFFKDNKSRKFWKIEVVKNTLRINYGKEGTAGVTQTKAFKSKEICLTEAQKLIKIKLNNGFSLETKGALTLVRTLKKRNALADYIDNIQLMRAGLTRLKNNLYEGIDDEVKGDERIALIRQGEQKIFDYENLISKLDEPYLSNAIGVCEPVINYIKKSVNHLKKMKKSSKRPRHTPSINNN